MIRSCRAVSRRAASRLASMMASVRRVVRVSVEWCERALSGVLARRGLAVSRTESWDEKACSRDGQWEGGWVVAEMMEEVRKQTRAARRGGLL